jgi:hypothetical protein
VGLPSLRTMQASLNEAVTASRPEGWPEGWPEVGGPEGVVGEDVIELRPNLRVANNLQLLIKLLGAFSHYRAERL